MNENEAWFRSKAKDERSKIPILVLVLVLSYKKNNVLIPENTKTVATDVLTRKMKGLSQLFFVISLIQACLGAHIIKDKGTYFFSRKEVSTPTIVR